MYLVTGSLLILHLLFDFVAPLSINDYSDGQCISSANPPTRPLMLTLCHWYNTKACCIPATDQDLWQSYNLAVGSLGRSCSVSKPKIARTYFALRQWYCIACDPLEPRYRFQKSVGDRQLAGGQQDGDPSVPETAVAWRVCKSFLNKVWKQDGTQYDSCGIRVDSPCGNGKQVVMGGSPPRVFETEKSVLQGWDPWMCGSVGIIPSQEYKNSPDPAVEFLNAVTPPGFGDVDFSFVVADDSQPDFVWEATPCFMGSTEGQNALSSAEASYGGLTVYLVRTMLVLLLVVG